MEAVGLLQVPLLAVLQVPVPVPASPRAQAA